MLFLKSYKHLRRLISILALLTVHQLLPAQGGPSTDPAGMVHIGHFLFTIPAGWNTQQQGDYFSITAPGLGPDELLMFLLLPPVTDMDFQRVGDATISQMAVALKGEAVEQAYAHHPFYYQEKGGQCLKGWDFSKGNGKIRIPYQEANKTYLSYLFFTIGAFMAKVHDRIERVCYLSKDYKCGPYSTTTSYKWTYTPVVNDFFFNLGFDDWTDINRRSGRMTSTGISGLWTGVSFIQGPTTYGQGYQAPKPMATFFALFDNGQVFYHSELPRFGFLNLNTISEAANNPEHWGTYTFHDGSGVMKISTWLTIPFTIVGGTIKAGLDNTSRDFQRVVSVEDTRLNGTWCEHGGAACIGFTGDGHFEDNGVIRVLEHEPTTCNEALPEHGQGTYAISNYSVVFRYTDGLVTQVALTGLGLQKGNSSPDQLFLGWQTDVLQKR